MNGSNRRVARVLLVGLAPRRLMKHGFLGAASLAVCLLASACAEDSSQPGSVAADAPPPAVRVLAADYSTTYFEYKKFAKELIPLGAAALMGMDSPERRGERQAVNVFEKRLGDFDTSDYFIRQFEARFGDSHHFQLTAAKDPAEQQKAIEFIRAFDDDKPEAVQLPLPGGGMANAIAGFKVVYGLGMKQGTEQLGFRKTHRLFIRLNGMVKDARTGEVLWRESILAFGDKGYEGHAVGNIDGTEMTATLKELTAKVIDLTMRSLNGEELPPMPTMARSTVLGEIADEHDF